MTWMRALKASAIICVALTAFSGIARAQDAAVPTIPEPAGSQAIPIQTEIIVPGTGVEDTAEGFFRGKVSDLAEYIGIVYRWLISIAGIVAAVFIVIGGFEYLMARGDPGKIAKAKDRIINALIGMCLALGAYVILSTVNKDLLSFKPLITKPVETELSFLPWCEDMIAQGAQVTETSSRTSCGEFGKFTPPGGSGISYCVYHGDCKLRNNTDFNATLTETCLQHPNLTVPDIEALVASGENGATCLPCAMINQAVATNTLGFGNLGDACQAWMYQVNSFRTTQLPQVENQPFWSYCAPADGYPGCVQADVNCQRANDNEDTGDGDCYDDRSNCGCEGYDDQPSPRVRTDNRDTVRNEFEYTYSDDDTLDSFPKHLAGMCFMNPCKNYVDPDTGKQSFFKGCKSGNGVVYTGQRAIRHGDFSFDDCRNR